MTLMKIRKSTGPKTDPCGTTLHSGFQVHCITIDTQAYCLLPLAVHKFVAIDRSIESIILLQQATFHDTASYTTTRAFKEILTFYSRGNDGIQVWLKNTNGLIEVSSMYDSCFGNM